MSRRSKKKHINRKRIYTHIIKVRCCTSSKRTFSEIADEWLRSVSHSLKESSAATYSHKLNKHIIPYFRDTDFSAISKNCIIGFIDYQISQGKSRQYVSYMLTIIKAIYRYAYDEYGYKNITLNIPALPASHSRVYILNSVQQEKLIHYLDTHPDTTSLAVAVSLFTGLRIGEICALKWSDIDLNETILHVNKTVQRITSSNGSKKTKVIITSPKSESSVRDIPLPPHIIDMLGSFKRDNDNYIISEDRDPVEPRTLQYRFERLLDDADLPQIRFHSLRHIFASNALMLGFDIKSLSEILGHSSANVTLKLYVHSSLGVKREYMNLLG